MLRKFNWIYKRLEKDIYVSREDPLLFYYWYMENGSALCLSTLYTVSHLLRQSYQLFLEYDEKE